MTYGLPAIRKTIGSPSVITEIRSLDAVGARGGKEAGGRFVERFVAQSKGAVVHRNHALCAKLERRAQLLPDSCALRVRWRIVGANREQRDVDLVALANFAESIEACGVAGNERWNDRRPPSRIRRSRDANRARRANPVMTRVRVIRIGSVLIAFPQCNSRTLRNPRSCNEITDFERAQRSAGRRRPRKVLRIEMIKMGRVTRTRIDRRKIAAATRDGGFA